MVDRYVASGELIEGVAGSAMQRLGRRHALAISMMSLLAGALTACGKKGALEAPPPVSETIGGENEERTK